MTVIHLKPRHHRELDTVDAEVARALLPLIQRHGVYLVTTVLVRDLVGIIGRLRAKRTASCDAWLDDMGRQLDRAIRRGGRLRRAWRALAALAALLGGCASIQPYSPPEAGSESLPPVTLPRSLIVSACQDVAFQRIVHWDGTVHLFWNREADTALGLDCGVWNVETNMHSWWLLEDICVPRKPMEALRDALTSQGFAIPDCPRHNREMYEACRRQHWRVFGWMQCGALKPHPITAMQQDIP